MALSWAATNVKAVTAMNASHRTVDVSNLAKVHIWEHTWVGALPKIPSAPCPRLRRVPAGGHAASSRTRHRGCLRGGWLGHSADLAGRAFGSRGRDLVRALVPAALLCHRAGSRTGLWAGSRGCLPRGRG